MAIYIDGLGWVDDGDLSIFDPSSVPGTGDGTGSVYQLPPFYVNETPYQDPFNPFNNPFIPASGDPTDSYTPPSGGNAAPSAPDYLSQARSINPAFDPSGYAARYQDLADAFRSDEQALAKHFLDYGQNEGRDPSAYDAQAVAAQQAALAAQQQAQQEAERQAQEQAAQYAAQQAAIAEQQRVAVAQAEAQRQAAAQAEAQRQAAEAAAAEQARQSQLAAEEMARQQAAAAQAEAQRQFQIQEQQRQYAAQQEAMRQAQLQAEAQAQAEAQRQAELQAQAAAEAQRQAREQAAYQAQQLAQQQAAAQQAEAQRLAQEQAAQAEAARQAEIQAQQQAAQQQATVLPAYTVNETPIPQPVYTPETNPFYMAPKQEPVETPVRSGITTPTGDLQSVDSLIAKGIGVNQPIPGQETTDESGNRAVWTTDSSGNVVLRTLPPGSYDPANPIPNLEIDQGKNVFDPAAILQSLGGQNGLGGILPFPVDPITAIAGSILLSGGIPNPFESGNTQGIVDRVEDIIKKPIETTNQTIDNTVNQIEHPSTIFDNPNGGASVPIIPLPSSNDPTNPVTTPPADQPTNPNTTIIPTGNNNSSSIPSVPTDSGQPPNIFIPPSTVNNGSATDSPQTPPNTTVTPTVTPGSLGGATTTTTPSDAPQPPDTTITPGSLGGATNPTPSDAPQPPNTTVIPTGTGGSGTGTGLPPISIIPSPTPTMPDTTITSPLDRNYYREGNQSTQDLAALYPGIANLYGNASRSYGTTDYGNFGNILGQYGVTNAGLTGLANQQTFDSNSALRASNLNDVGNMAGQAYGIQKQYNPNLYGSLDRYGQGANDLLSKTSANLNAKNYLTPQEIDQAQQSARAAWSARGLINSPGAVGAEILGVDSAWRQRQQQAIDNQNNALQSYGQQTAIQSANQFNPFSTILGAQYGQQTQNVGTNQGLYSNIGGFSSGQMGNQYVQQAYNPFNNYSNDVYGSNFNAANARSISAANNAAAVAAGKQVANSNYADMFMNALYGIGQSKGWF